MTDKNEKSKWYYEEVDEKLEPLLINLIAGLVHVAGVSKFPSIMLAIKGASFTLTEPIRKLYNEKKKQFETAEKLAIQRGQDCQKVEQKLEAAEKLCQIYFEIAEEALGEEKVRELRDSKIEANKNDE